MPRPLILVTNDDGIRAPGIGALAEALQPLGDVRVYAPESQQSAVGHGVSLHKPLRASQIESDWWAIDGTPTDCVMLAVRALLGQRPDLVVSGVNDGPNLGDDVTYSGTVAGAYEGMLLGLPALAVSMARYGHAYLETGAAVAARMAAHVLEHGLPEQVAYSINVPAVPYDELRGLRFTRMGRRHYEDDVIERFDPRGRRYYWIGGSEPSHEAAPGTDFEAIEAGMVSVTPLIRDLTDYAALEQIHDHQVAL